MANIVVKVVKDANNNNCLKIMDGDECKTNPIESGAALRRILHLSDPVSWSNPDGKTLTITFPNNVDPFGGTLTAPGPTVTATVAGNATQGRYKYTIAVTVSAGVIVQEDPQVVIDTGTITILGGNKQKGKKQKGKKQ